MDERNEEKAPVYEAPSIVEVGDFRDVTRLKTAGNWIDSPWGAFCIGDCG